MKKKQVGIVTLVHVRNIGAVLQAYALKTKIEQFGYDVIFLKVYGKRDALEFFKGDMGSIRPCTIKFLTEKNNKFKTSFSAFSEVTLEKVDLSNLDAIILGSDSIWIPKNGKRYMPKEFFGDINAKKIYSYAASSGGIIDSKLYTEQQKKALKNIDIITVRDSYTQSIINQLIGKNARIVLDPTLLLDWKEEIDKFNFDNPKVTEMPYLVVYGGVSEQTVKKIVLFAKKNNLVVLNIGSYNKLFENNIAVSPFEFLNYIYGAKLVITSMFHGVMLSLSYKKNFIYLSRDKNRDIKISTTMKLLGFEGDKWKWDLKNEFTLKGTLYPIDFESRKEEMKKYSVREIEKMLGLYDDESK